MLKRTRSPLRRQNPRRPSASVRFGAQRPPPKAGVGGGAGGIPIRWALELSELRARRSRGLT